VRPEAHTPPTGVAGPETSIDTTRSERVQRGKPIGCYGRNTIGRNQHTGAELDPIGLHGGGTHRDENIGTQKLSVVEPRSTEPGVLSALYGLPGIGRRGKRDTKIYLVFLLFKFVRFPTVLRRGSFL
jgi:hypothetical protein